MINWDGKKVPALWPSLATYDKETNSHPHGKLNAKISVVKGPSQLSNHNILMAFNAKYPKLYMHVIHVCLLFIFPRNQGFHGRRKW